MNEIGRKIADKLIEIAGTTDFTIAFLPYKRSMWNCMESVYEELIASGVDAHCMPIPYIRKKLNDEVDYYDSDFDMFDNAEDIKLLDDMHPRFCVIHYPYDGHNRVTSMLPEYYTQTIKDRYKTEVVFIPYGVALNEPLTKDIGGIDFGLIGVDYIMAASENSRQNLIYAFSLLGFDYSDRIFATGSPKIDAARKAKKDIPAEWAPIIEDRPVTLICNSLIPYIESPQERMRSYYEMVHRELNKGRAVIFRPHPLLETTIKSMVPHSGERYERLIIDLSRAPHVIVDKSEYLERAIGIADYLITDPSSIILMWDATGKEYEVI